MTIPADIEKRAAEIVGTNFRWMGPFEVSSVIASAIMEERERCAQIATSHGNGRAQQSKLAKKERLRVEARDFESMTMQAYQIASAIRNEGEQGE